MNPNKTISMIHTALAGLIIFLSLSFILVFIVLQHGITIEKIQFSSIKIEELYIKWNEKLCVEVELLEISSDHPSQDSGFNANALQDFLRNSALFIKWFERISLSTIHVKEIEGTFYYDDSERGYLNLMSPSFELESTLELEKNILHVNLHPFALKQYSSAFLGTLKIDIDKKKLYAPLSLSVNSKKLLNIDANITTEAIVFHVSSDVAITDLKSIAKEIPLPQNIRYWAIENLRASQYHVDYIKGVYRFKHPERFVTELDAKAHGNNASYRFSETLSPLESKRISVHFKDGILHIRPSEGSYEHHQLPHSYLDIDFSQPEYHLYAHIITDTPLDATILKVLNTYGVKLPIMQTAGTTDANLRLDIDLHTLSTKAKGSFKVKKGSFLFKEENLHVNNMALNLEGSNVTIKKALISYKDYIDANVHGYLDPIKNRSDLHITPKRIAIGDLTLDNRSIKLAARYRLDPKKETLSLSPSSWNHGSKKITLEAFEAPFRFNDLSITLPNIALRVDDMLQGRLSGDVNLSKASGNITLHVNRLDYQNLKLQDKQFDLNVLYDKQLNIQTQQFAHFQYEGHLVTIAPFELETSANRVEILKSKIYIEDYVDFQLSGVYHPQNETGNFKLDYIQTYPQELYRANDHLEITYKKLADTAIFECNPLALKMYLSPEGWNVALSDLTKIAAHSVVMKENFIDQGTVNIGAKHDEKSIKFNAAITYPYALLVKENTLQHHYDIKGTYRQGITQLSVNDDVNVKIADGITIDAQNVGLNMVALIDLLDAKKQERTSSKQQLVINTTNGFLYLSPQRKVLYDAIYLNQKGSDISASLQHHGANASFELKNDIFNLRGEHFDDVFMNHLLAIAEHKEGSLYFYMYGSFKEFQGVLKVNDTILKEYKVINNVLAFANTLPALSTFSLPDYSTKGLHVQEAYGGFSYQNKNITILDASLSAKELKLYGNGILNFPNNQIDMKLSLKTDLGSKLSQIPIVGYLLFGEDGSVSTTLTIDGKLDDPTVSNAVAKDIVVAPFQLLKRTLLLPAHLIEQIE